ncbi:LysR family transcriptional regulator [Brachybacterium kimchii]|uniref:LysR family transcriptional regulator n=1 Tax=Brachybacterium kimchii TaxID=2942909 RepID=A0ABY4N798_9MICO|nr:LysR family transcriptional regulator [Brachybacterium kimchii]UQN30433.1 LysR family transcriptional regulator [Brachybacterium kimchii]
MAVDLNLMRVFVAVFETRSLTSAAQRLFVTQSAVSQSLRRLRVHFGDPLFERRAGQMSPTPVALDAYGDLRQALDHVDAALSRVRDFDPTTSRRTFRVALSELGEIGWMGAIVAEVRRVAPEIVVESVALDQEQLGEWLRRGHVDVAIAPADDIEDVISTRVKDQDYAVVMVDAHPLASAPLTVEDCRRSPHAAVMGDSGAAHLDSALRRGDAYERPAAYVQRFAALPGLLMAQPELLAFVPRSIAEGWRSSLGFAIRDLPIDVPPVRLHVCRRGTSQSQGALDWFYETTVRAVVSSQERFEAIRADARPQSSEGR